MAVVIVSYGFFTTSAERTQEGFYIWISVVRDQEEAPHKSQEIHCDQSERPM